MLGPDAVMLTGRVAVVTGAAMGIGEAVAEALARFGADVAVCDRDGDMLDGTVASVEQTGRAALEAVLDVRDVDAVRDFLTRVGERFGRVDVLVNNAGGGFHAAFLDTSDKGQDALVRENYESVTNLIRSTVPLMHAGGSIVNITSVEAHRAAPGYAVYASMKAAVSNLTMTLALELGDRMIRVNCVAPDVIPTPGVGHLPDPPRTPLPIAGHTDHVAGAVVFLAGELSAFVTGTTIHVDGGNDAAGGWRRRDDGSFGL